MMLRHYLHKCLQSLLSKSSNNSRWWPGLQQRTSMTVKHIICLLEFCLKNTYFIFQGRFYEQVEGAAMGSPISPIIATIYMEAFETQAISRTPHPPSLWRRFVDDTFVVIQRHRRTASQSTSVLLMTNSVHCEDCRSDGSMPFLDTVWSHQHQMAVWVPVYRKPPTLICTCSGTGHHTIAAK